MMPAPEKKSGPNFALWWAEIQAVIRLEMRKTFFAKRGLWVYILALAPVLLFMGRAIDLGRTRESRQEMAAAHPVSGEALRYISASLDDDGGSPATIDSVIKEVGEPYSRRSRTVGRRQRQVSIVTMNYTDGQDDYSFTFVDNELRGVNRRDRPSLQQDTLIFATVFQFFYLRLAIFFGCVGIFMNLFRGELIDKSLHFYLLAPIRREVLLVGKYLAGLIATVVIFTTSTALQLWMLMLAYDSTTRAQYLGGAGWHHITAYLGVTALACLGYGSVFLAAGLLFRNPIIPAATVLLWESANLFLPAVLKKISIIFYLQSICPVVAPPSKDMPALLALLISSAEATPAWLAALGLFALTAVILAVASLQARKLEINYSSD
jgi:ABC-type transport system involved in multi-copper enzyme maturation permease subunit